MPLRMTGFPHYLQYQILLQMETQKMERKESPLISLQIHSPTFDEVNFDINQIFERVKTLVAMEVGNNQKPKKEQKLKSILKFIGTKMNSQWMYSTKQFIGMLVIYLYVIRFQQIYSLSLNFRSKFYQNFNAILQKTYDEWVEEQGKPKEHRASTNLITILFAMASLCEMAENNMNKKIQLKKLLNTLTMETFLKFQLPDHQKILKYYKTIMLQILKKREYLNEKNLLIKSAAYHYLRSSSNEETQTACLYIMSVSYKGNKDGQVIDDTHSMKIVEQLRKNFLKIEKKQIFGLSLLLGAKLLKKKDKETILNFLNNEELMNLILLKENFEFSYSDIQGIIGFLKVFDERRLINFIELVVLNLGKSLMCKKIINEIIPFLMPHIVFQILQKNLLSKLYSSIQPQMEESILIYLDTLKKILEKSFHFNFHIRLVIKTRIREDLELLAPMSKTFPLNFSILKEMLSTENDSNAELF